MVIRRADKPLSAVILAPSPPIARRTLSTSTFNRFSPGLWDNEITLRSTRAARMYEPGAWVARVSPTPLLMIVARNDQITVTDLALAAYERALEPKWLALFSGGHFDPYLDQFPLAEAAATAWFQEHLLTILCGPRVTYTGAPRNLVSIIEEMMMTADNIGRQSP